MLINKPKGNTSLLCKARVVRRTLAFFAACTPLVVGAIIGTEVFATDGSGSSEVNAVVKESISVGIDHNGLAFSITPTAVGAFASKSTNIHVYTNAKGYKLYISSKTAETSLKHIDSSVTKPIQTLGVLKGAGAAIDKDAFTVNSWGYSLDGTNFYGVS